jgi:hypothetical protein
MVGVRWEATGPAGSLSLVLDTDITISPAEDQNAPAGQGKRSRSWQQAGAAGTGEGLPPLGRREPGWARRCRTGWSPRRCVLCCTVSPGAITSPGRMEDLCLRRRGVGHFAGRAVLAYRGDKRCRAPSSRRWK